MDIFPIPMTIEGVESAEFVNYDAGVTLSVRECADKSGFVGTLMDAFTGESIRKFFGSRVETVCIAANNHVKKFAIYKVLAQ